MSADLDLDDALRARARVAFAARVHALIDGLDLLALLDRVKTAEQERDAVNAALRKFGIEYPLGARGVYDLAGMATGRLEDLQAAEARLAKVQALADRLDRRGCLSCSSMTGGDDLAAELREALGGEQ